MWRCGAAALALFAGLSAAGIHYGPSPITGDEIEYYAMTYAWATNGSPALTPQVVAAVREAFPGRPPTEPASARAIDGSYNALHFWFLSLLAAPFFALCRIAGLDWKHCFVFLNALLLAGAAALAYRWFRWFGALVLVAGLLDSPLVPYLNKAHGEVYTVSLAAVSALCLVTGRWLAAALALAAIAAQVSAFSPLAVLAFGKWAFDERKRALRCPSPRQWAAIVGFTALLALQPLWTLWRYHQLNLIVAGGFVFPEMATPRRIASMLLDPDVGFFFIWPLGVLLPGWIVARLFLEPGLARRYRWYWVLVVLLFAEVAWIGAEQMNYTTSAPRYSLWFIPFLLVGFVVVSQSERSRPIVAATGFAAAALAAGWYLFLAAGVHPSLERKPLAELWYRYLPGVWDPEEQVFADISIHEQLESGRELFRKRRFPIDRLLNPHVWAVSNRSCTKLLVFGYAFTSSHVEPLPPLGCDAPADGRRLLEYVRSKGITGMEDRYVSVPPPWRPHPDIPAQSETLPSDSPPRVDGYDVSEARGSKAVYAFRFSHPDGWQNLTTMTMRIAGCYVIYDQPRHELSLLRENGTITAAAVPGRPDDLKSASCSVDTQNASISASGDSLTVKLPVTLDQAAEKTAIRAFVGASSEEATFEPLGGDRIRIAWPEAISRLWVLINDKRSEENSCYFEYELANHMLRLTPDNGDGAQAPAMLLGGGRSLENGQCIVSGEDRDSLLLQVVRKGLFAADKRVWIRYQEAEGALSGWQGKPPWRGADSKDSSPSVSLQPDARGDLLHLQFRYGLSELRDVAKVWVLINDSLDAAKSCYLTYVPESGTVYLNGAGRMALRDGGALANPQCEVDGRESAASQTATTLDLRLRIKRKDAFRSPKRVWAADQKIEYRSEGAKVSPWMLAGTWR